MNATQVAHNLRGRIGRFSGDLSNGLCLPTQRFVSEMVYGMQASESELLTEVGRTPLDLLVRMRRFCAVLMPCPPTWGAGVSSSMTAVAWPRR